MLDYNNDFSDIVVKYPDYCEMLMLKKGHSLFEIGEIANANYYIESGIVRGYTFVFDNDNKEEITLGFFADGEALIPYRSFSKTSSILLNLEVIEDAVIYKISSDNWKKIEEQEPKLHELMYNETNKIIRGLLLHSIINASYDAKNRYKLFLANKEYAPRIKDEYAASYIRVTSSSLSRIKAEIIKENRRKHK